MYGQSAFSLYRKEGGLFRHLEVPLFVVVIEWM